MDLDLKVPIFSQIHSKEPFYLNELHHHVVKYVIMSHYRCTLQGGWGGYGPHNNLIKYPPTPAKCDILYGVVLQIHQIFEADCHKSRKQFCILWRLLHLRHLNFTSHYTSNSFYKTK